MGLLVSSNGSGYTTATKVRNYAGIPSTTDVSDADMATIIQYASRELFNDTALRVFNERLVGDIDGSNTRYRMAHPYLADRNLDVSVNSSDLVVRSGTFNTDGTITRAVLTVSSVDATGGYVVLSSAPATTVDFIECDYAYYRRPVWTDDLEAACNALCAHVVYVRNKDPSRVTLSQLKGPVASSGSRWKDEYDRLVTKMRGGELIGSDRANVNATDTSDSIER